MIALIKKEHRIKTIVVALIYYFLVFRYILPILLLILILPVLAGALSHGLTGLFTVFVAPFNEERAAEISEAGEKAA